MSKIKNITVVDGSTSQRVTVPAAISQIYYNDKNNLNIETTADDMGSNGKGGKINFESVSDIQFKPGDDIIFYSHHRAEDSQDEVALKITDGDDKPVKLQLNASEVLLTTKDKEGTNANIMDITVNSAKNTRGYLKVRAQAIDLRSESHGGIALQPKGKDSEGHMNKIKFEHGGGDGLEFGTFNTEKTSIFTDEYRFNKDGIWKMATREKEESDKKEVADPTTHYKYKKQADDFYDIIDSDDEQCTTNNIIKTANAFNGEKDRHTKITSKGNLEIATVNTVTAFLEGPYIRPEEGRLAEYYTDQEGFDKINQTVSSSQGTPSLYTLNELLSLDIAYTKNGGGNLKDDIRTAVSNKEVEFGICVTVDGLESSLQIATYYLRIIKKDSPNINLESDSNVEIKAGNKIKFEGSLDFGNVFDFGETGTAINVNKKYTKSGNTKNYDTLRVTATNNHETNSFTTKKITNTGGTYNESDVTIPAGTSQTIASCSIYDIIKLVNYVKYSKTGPWTE